MFCQACGAANTDNAFRCVSCGQQLQQAPPVKIENNLVLAIVVTALCCMPFGIVGIVYAAQVNGKAQLGDIAGAQESARKARMWSLWGMGVGLAVIAVYVVAAVIGVVA